MEWVHFVFKRERKRETIDFHGNPYRHYFSCSNGPETSKTQSTFRFDSILYILPFSLHIVNKDTRRNFNSLNLHAEVLQIDANKKNDQRKA